MLHGARRPPDSGYEDTDSADAVPDATTTAVTTTAATTVAPDTTAAPAADSTDGDNATDGEDTTDPATRCAFCAGAATAMATTVAARRTPPRQRTRATGLRPWPGQRPSHIRRAGLTSACSCRPTSAVAAPTHDVHGRISEPPGMS